MQWVKLPIAKTVVPMYFDESASIIIAKIDFDAFCQFVPPLAQSNQFVGLFMHTSKIIPNRALCNAAMIIVQIHSNRAISIKLVVFLL